MEEMWRRIFGTMALAFMLCLTGLVMSGTAFAERCVDNGDGTVTDNSTRLMWQKAGAGPMNWDAAMSYASGLSLGEYSDWRLPSKAELLGLSKSPCRNMMVVVGDWYWSSTPSYTYTGFYMKGAWVVYFNGDNVADDYKSSRYFVRAVREAQ